MALFGNKTTRSDKLNGVVNAAKTLLANIRFMSVDDPVRTIVITSAVPNEGKTFVAANLASAIATSGRTVLVVECDMRRRSMANVLGVHAQYGLYAVVAGEVPLTKAAVATETPNLYFLDAEPHIPNPSDLLNSHRFARLIEISEKTFDYVVFDTPPVGTFVDAAVLGAKADAVFMVVREGFTKKAEVVAAVDQLKKSGCNLAGIVMNYCERTTSEYYYEYYYSKEGHKDDNAPKLDEEHAAAAAPAAKPAVPKRPERRERPVEATEQPAAAAPEPAAEQPVAETHARHVSAASIPQVVADE